MFVVGVGIILSLSKYKDDEVYTYPYIIFFEIISKSLKKSLKLKNTHCKSEATTTKQSTEQSYYFTIHTPRSQFLFLIFQ